MTNLKIMNKLSKLLTAEVPIDVLDIISWGSWTIYSTLLFVFYSDFPGVLKIVVGAVLCIASK